jgi:hypothetical protein
VLEFQIMVDKQFIQNQHQLQQAKNLPIIIKTVVIIKN